MIDWLDRSVTWLGLALATIWGLTFGALSRRVGHLETAVDDLKCARAEADANLKNIEKKLDEIGDDVKHLLQSKREDR